MPGRTSPRSENPKSDAGTNVSFRIASSSDMISFSRTQCDKQISGVTIVGAKNHVSPAVRLPDDGVRTGEQSCHGRLVAVDFAPFEFGFQIFFQRQVQESIEHVFILFPRDVGHAFARQVLVFSQRRA